MKFSDFDTEFSERGYREMVEVLNVLLRSIDSENFSNNSRVIDIFGRNVELFENITIASGTTKTLNHNLGAIPRFRIYLKMVGGYQISDSAFPWTDKKFYINNGSASSITVSVLLIK